MFNNTIEIEKIHKTHIRPFTFGLIIIAAGFSLYMISVGLKIPGLSLAGCMVLTLGVVDTIAMFFRYFGD
jgi:multisubunit Na+/H+ antiporter MnhB subunit